MSHHIPCIHYQNLHKPIVMNILVIEITINQYSNAVTRISTLGLKPQNSNKMIFILMPVYQNNNFTVNSGKNIYKFKEIEVKFSKNPYAK